MKLWLTITLLFLELAAMSATYYVDTTNSVASNSNDGSQGTPWKTIAKATSFAVAGDTVIIQPGVYNENVLAGRDGTAGNPITFTGVRGASGEWLTIIDPSTLISNGWVTASEIGSGVWKKTNMTFQPKELTINTQRVAYVADMGGPYATGYTNFSDGASAMAAPTNTQSWLGSFGGGFVYFWDTIEALWGSTNATTTYLRYRDGRDPNGALIRASPDGKGIYCQHAYNTWKNFHIRGVFTGIYLETDSAHHNIVLSNYVEGGFKKIALQASYGDPGPHHNTIQNNEITENYYGTTNTIDFGAWNYNDHSAWIMRRKNMWEFSKFLMGAGGVDSEALYGLNIGDTNVFTGNHIWNTFGDAVMLENQIPHVPYIAWGTEISSNTISGSISFAFMMQEGLSETKIHDNFVSDYTIFLRYHKMNWGDTNRVTYVYRNTCYLTNGLGEDLLVYADDDNTHTYWPVLWVYQNSFSGGEFALEDNGHVTANHDWQNIHFLNNIFNDSSYSGGAGGVLTESTLNGPQFDYNMVCPPSVSNAAWFGIHNIVATTNQWKNATNMSFVLPSGSQAIDSGVDIPTAYPALPQNGTVKVGSAWDIGALEYSPGGNISAGTIYIGTLRSP